MTTQDVVEIVKLLKENNIDIVIDGGWGVDALLGKQTRRHQDLDVAVKLQDISKIRTLLEKWGF